MQKIIRIIFSFLVLVTYMVTTIGFGVHECKAKGTKHILLISSDRPCDKIHKKCSCGLGGCSVNKHSNSCCSTEIYHLDLDYDNNVDSYSTSFSFEPISTYFPIIKFDFSLVSALSLNGSLETKHGPPLYSYSKEILATIAKWRL